MGTDIHGVLQVRYTDSTPWHSTIEIETIRNYRTFAALANVRNGSGFAGVKTHQPIRPISEPRGLPEDFDKKEAKWVVLGFGSWEDEENEVEWLLGDHDFSWLTLDEILEWDGWDQTLYECGYISREDFSTWDGESPPKNGWCGSIGGVDIRAVDFHDPVGESPVGWTHIRVYWSRSLRESCDTFLKWAEYAKSRVGNAEARIVFGFDS